MRLHQRLQLNVMWELLAAVKLNALLGEGVKSLATTAVKAVGTKAGNAVIDRFLPRKTGDPFGEFGPVADTIRALSFTAGERQEVTSFFNSSLFASVVRASPAFTVGGENQAQLSLISLYLKELLPSKPPELVQNLAAEVVLRLKHASAAALEEATSQGIIFRSEDAISSAHGLVASEIANLTAQVSDPYIFSLEQFRSYAIFEEQYRRQVGRHFAKIKPEALGDAKSVPINDLYVASDLRPFRSGATDQPISREVLLKSSFRTVILGNPGGGKSTFVKKLCHDLASRYEDALYGNRKLTPVVIILREFAQYRKQNPCSIVEYATLRAKVDYQIDSIPDEAMRYLFITGRAVVIFDGLDELIETADRLNVTQAVEHFTDQYQATPILVTSREVGYEQAPLDADRFAAYKLQPFSPTQMEAYVHSWFRVTGEDTKSVAEALADSFIRDSSVVPDLRENPLMLSLLCNLYKKDKHLPSNRPEVYKRCADLLFENWDKFRGIIISLPIEKKLRPAMDYLAHWIYSDKSLQGGVTEKAIVSETGHYLNKWCADTDEAIATAEKFVHFFKGRAWVFSDVGASKSEPLYGFTHNTFLEFFTAEFIVKNSPDSPDLCSRLFPRLLNREWDVVCQLCFQMYAEMRNASDDLTTRLVDEIYKRPLGEKLRLSSFLARSLDLIFPTRLVRATAVAVCTQSFIEAVVELDNPGNDNSRAEMAGLCLETWAGLTNCDRDLRDVNTVQVREQILKYIRGEASDDRSKGALLATLDMIKNEAEDLNFQDPDRKKEWENVYRSIREETRSIRISLLPRDLRLAQTSWWEREATLADILRMYGDKGVTTDTPFLLGHWFRGNIAGTLMNYCVYANPTWDVRLEDAMELRDYWIHKQTMPQFGSETPALWMFHIRNLDGHWPSEQKLRDLVALIGVTGNPPQSNSQIAKDLIVLASPRRDPDKTSEATACANQLELSQEAIKMIQHWWTI
jgi:NACHT domain